MASSRKLPVSYNEKTYGASGYGRDYTSLATWEDATDNNLVTASKGEVLTCYADASTFNDSVSLENSTTNSSYFRVIRAAPGNRGTKTSGVRFVSLSLTADRVQISLREKYACAYDLAARVTSSLTAAGFGLYYDGCACIGCTCHDTTSSTSNGIGFYVRPLESGYYDIINCFVDAVTSSGTYKGGIVNLCTTAGLTANVLVYNSTIKNNIIGIQSTATAGAVNIYSKNNIYQSNTTLHVTGSGCFVYETTNVTAASPTAAFIADGYHLNATDTVARGNGTNLSSDSNYAFDDDIDGDTRPSTWDIGADQYKLTNVYYSVCPFGTGDIKTGTPTISIASGVATLSVNQTGNIGIGVGIVFGSITVYISAINSASSFDVVTVTGKMPSEVSTPQTVTSIRHEFASLSAAEAAWSGSTYLNGTNLTTLDVVINLCCYYDHDDGTLDTTVVLFNVGTTDSTRFFRIKTPKDSTESILSQRHSGKFTTTRYVLDITSVTDYASIIRTNDQNLVLEGVQIRGNSGSYQDTRFIQKHGVTTNFIKLYECILVGGVQSTLLLNTYGIANFLVVNSVLYNASSGAYITVADSSLTVHNSVIANISGAAIRSSNVTVKNSAIFNNGDDFYAAPTSLTYSAGDDAEFGSGTGNIQWTSGATNWAANFTDYANGDFTTIAGSALRDAGDTIADFSTDIIGTARPQNSVWDIGPFEYIISGASSVYSDLISLFDLVGRTSSDSIGLFDLRNIIQSDSVSLYDVLSTVNSDSISLFDLRNIVNSDLIGLYDINNKINSDLISLFGIEASASRIASDLINLFDLHNKIQSDSAHLFDLRNIIQSGLISLFDLNNKILSDSVHLFDLRNITYSDLASLYDSSGKVQSGLISLFDLRNIIQSDSISLFDVWNLVQADSAQLFSIRNKAYSDLITVYSSSGKVLSDSISLFNLRNKILSDSVSLFDVRNKILSDSISLFNLRNKAYSDSIMVYDSSGKVYSGSVFLFDITGVGSGANKLLLFLL